MRERLAALYQQTHTFTAYFSRYSKTKEKSNMVCLSIVRLEGRMVADHVWVHRSKVMKVLDLHSGDRVQFEARVGRYARTGDFASISEIEWEFSLEKVRNFVILERADES
jgi:hypothetical protein